jgi:CheY-like chemotaxis protein
MDSILKGKRILVVEDEEVNFYLIRDILENFQTLITWAEVGQLAIDLVRQGEEFDLVLMDINLPAMDGIEVTREIKKIRPNLPIVAQTAFALDSEIQNCFDAGCSGYVLKPFTMSELVKVVVKALEEN